jgi:TM2 domain-containing membrane protein YozV
MENNSNPIDYETPNSLAAVWSMMLPGLGQLMKGRIMPGIFWAFFTAAGYFSFFWPGIFLHCLCVVDAAFSKGEKHYLSLIGTVSLMICYIVARNHYS